MNPQTNYEMAQEDLDKILEVCKPTPCIMIGGSTGPGLQENANNAWAALGKKMGFDSMTVRPSSKGNRFFSAVPTDTKEQVEAKKRLAEEEERSVEIKQLKEDITEKKARLEEILNLCHQCSKEFASCDGNPKFGTGKGNDNVYECAEMELTIPKET